MAEGVAPDRLGDKMPTTEVRTSCLDAPPCSNSAPLVHSAHNIRNLFQPATSYSTLFEYPIAIRSQRNETCLTRS